MSRFFPLKELVEKPINLDQDEKAFEDSLEATPSITFGNIYDEKNAFGLYLGGSYNTNHKAIKPIRDKGNLMTLVYVLLGFAGLTGVAIAKDEFEKLGAPISKAPSRLDCEPTDGDTV